MASLRSDRTKADGTPYWSVLYRLDGRKGKQQSISFEGDDGEADARYALELFNTHGPARALEILNIDRDERRGLTVSQFLTRHVDHLTGVEQKTIDDYRRYIRRDLHTLARIPLTALTENDIATWVKHLETTGGRSGTGQSAKTIKNKHGFLSGALATAVPRYIAANPAAGRRLPRGTGDDHEMVFLSRDDVATLLKALTEPWRPLVEFLVASGCRWGEATALRPDDVDTSTGTVRIRRAWKYSSHGWKLGPPKTKRSRRDIKVSKTVLAKLDYSHDWLFVGRDGPNWRKAGNDPVRIHGFHRRVWQPALDRSGLVERPRVHDLRHTCASWMIAAGVPLPVISRHLGHESIQVTVDVYGHLDGTSAQAAADAVGDMLD